MLKQVKTGQFSTMDIFKHYRFIIICFIMAVYSGYIPAVFNCTAFAGKDHQEDKAVSGVIDLSVWNPAEKNSIHLDGDWEFYGEQLLTPASFMKTNKPELSAYVEVPGIWHVYDTVLPKPGREGYATYRLNLVNIPGDVFPLYIYMREVPTAYRLWADGKPVAGNGVVGKNESESSPWFQPGVYKIESNSSEIELVLQVSNFFHKDGGLWYSIEVGTGRSFFMKPVRLMLFDMLFFGSLMIMGLYHLALFALRPKEKAPLFFGLFCMCIGLRSLMIGQRITYVLFPELEWWIQQKLEFGLLYLSFPSFLFFFYSLFPKDVSIRLIQLVAVFILCLCLLVTATPVKIFAHSALYFQVIMFVMVVYIGARLVPIIRNRREGGILFLCGFCVLFLAAIHDTLYTHLLIQSRSIAHVSVFLFIFFQSFLLSKKFSGAFSKVEEMTETLKDKNKKLIEADELKNEFLANTSHELRTPLHGIMGLAESMLSSGGENLDSRQIKNLGLIAASGRRLFNLINDLLDFSKIRRQQVTLDLRPVDLKGLSRLVIEFSTPLASAKGIHLEEEIPTNLSWVMADEDRLQQILFNLVGNAVKFTPSGRIFIRAFRIGNKVEVAVCDTGVGIAHRDQERVFNAFEQGDGSSGREFPGTGLGLAISRKLVKLHGSQLTLKSEPEKGSEFSFLLDEAKAPSDAPEKRAPLSRRWACLADNNRHVQKNAPVETDGNQIKILVVDDEPVNLELVCNYLDSDTSEYTVITAGNGYEALESLEEEPDLVLLDIMMPGMNGFDVCRQLRGNPRFSTIPVIILSAKNQISDLVQGLECGANDYLPKPFYREELLARIRAHIKAGEAVKQLEVNRLLKEEIGRRESVELDLRISRRILARILDSSEDAMIVLDDTGTITFFNQGAERLFGITTNEAIYQSIDVIVDTKSTAEIMKMSDILTERPDERLSLRLTCKHNTTGEFDSQAFLALFTIDRDPYRTLIVKSSLSPVEYKTNESDRESKIKAIKNAFITLPDYVAKNSISGQSDLREIPSEFDDTDDILDKNILNDKFRRLLVETMGTALTCWEVSTGKSKVELSEESGIWKAYLDGGTWKTRTLDKYLSLKTLPGKPRWREVLRTANFVLSKNTGSSANNEKLKELVEQVEQTLRYTQRRL